MRLVVSSSPRDEWAGWLEKFEGNVYHSPDWADIQYSNHSRPLFFHLLDGEQCTGIALGTESWSPIPLVGRLSKRLTFESYPVVEGGNEDLTRSMIKHLLDFARGNGYRGLSVHSSLANFPVRDMDQLGFNTSSRIEFILDLMMEEEELWKNLATHHKRKIRKATKHDLHLEEASTLDAFREFSRLQRMSRERRVKRGEQIGLLDDVQFEELGRGYFDKNLGRVFLMLNDDEAVSAAFVSIYAGQALYVYGGSSDKGFKLDAPGLLFWHIFSRCRELGCREFNLGGVPASAVKKESQSHGLYRFKAGFGARQVECVSGSVENLNRRLNWILGMPRKIPGDRSP